MSGLRPKRNFVPGTRSKPSMMMASHLKSGSSPESLRDCRFSGGRTFHSTSRAADDFKARLIIFRLPSPTTLSLRGRGNPCVGPSSTRDARSIVRRGLGDHKPEEAIQRLLMLVGYTPQVSDRGRCFEDSDSRSN